MNTTIPHTCSSCGQGCGSFCWLWSKQRTIVVRVRSKKALAGCWLWFCSCRLQNITRSIPATEHKFCTPLCACVICFSALSIPLSLFSHCSPQVSMRLQQAWEPRTRLLLALLLAVQPSLASEFLRHHHHYPTRDYLRCQTAAHAT